MSAASQLEQNQKLNLYMVAFLATIGALLLRFALNPYLGTGNHYHTVWLAVVVAAWYRGLGPGIFSAVLSLLGVWYFFIPPYHSFDVANREDIFGMVGFFVFACGIAAFGETNQRSIRKKDAAESGLLSAQQDLEKRVEERTAQLRMASESLRALTGQVLRVQDEERRRIARELHDSIGQLLAGIKMQVDRLQGNIVPSRSSELEIVNDISQLVQRATDETRTISYLLHPPLLEEVGLPSALRWLVEGFEKRSQIKIGLGMPEPWERLPLEMETALFRIVQECLANVHRHSGSGTATILLHQVNGQVRLEVSDQGREFIAGKTTLRDKIDSAAGVGILGMRQRLAHLGGTLEVASNQNGTTVIATLPTISLAAGTPTSAAP